MMVTFLVVTSIARFRDQFVCKKAGGVKGVGSVDVRVVVCLDDCNRTGMMTIGIYGGCFE